MDSSGLDGRRPPRGGELGRHRRTLAISLLVVALGYFVGGKAGLLLAVGNASVSAVWPPTGIAIAALLLGGPELWPAVFVGAFWVNITTTGDIPSSLGIATGNTLEALVGAYLAKRFAGGKDFLGRPQSVLTFALLSGLLASTVAATIGTTSLTLVHLARPGAFFSVWTPWWLGDAVGAAEVTPLILAVALRLTQPASIVPAAGRIEAVALALVTVAVALVVFTRAPTTFLGGYPLVFLVIPPSIWGALRFGSLGATTSVSTVSVIAILATVSGAGPFATLSPGVSLLALRIFIGSLVLTALLVAADVVQHRRLENELNRTRKELQRMLRERTAQLDAAKSLANVGDWSYSVVSRKMVWSDEIYRIFGYGEERFPVVLESALDRMRPADRASFLRELADAVGSTTPMNRPSEGRKYRLELPTGETRTVLSTIEVTAMENGRVTRVSGTVQDISERQRIEDELQRLQRGQEAPPEFEGGFSTWVIPWMQKRSP